MPDVSEYNPLDYENLTINLVRELMQRTPSPLPPAERFRGAGVYALFYRGGFGPYQHPYVRSDEAEHPIYVGKAVPAGARTGSSRGGRSSASELYSRLREHSESIGVAQNLELADFVCRFLVVTPLWITMAERFLIENFQPVWNVCIEGFGLHDPGRGRHQGLLPWWDALHPGRAWAASLQQGRTSADAETRLREFLALREADPAEARRRAAQAAANVDAEA